MKPEMLYISHVDWNWIKQRPHFIAEELMSYFDISVMYLYQRQNRKALQKRGGKDNNVTPLHAVPLGRRIKALHSPNNAFIRSQVAHKIKQIKAEYVFLTYPLQIDYLPANYSGTVIYDCMDDHAALSPAFLRETVEAKERAILKRADVVLHSSNNLREMLIQHYGNDFNEKMYLVRNGYSGTVTDAGQKVQKDKEYFTISYFGTIGKWFNFDYILKSVQDIPNLRYKIIGPADTELPVSDRIEYTGTVEHDKLYDTIKDTDCLSMPFVVNDIVLSVDPVKLYEYINYNMNILCVRYPEVERFDPFVYFYEDYDSFVSQIKKMMDDNTVKYDSQTRLQFLQESSWENRAREIMQALSNT